MGNSDNCGLFVYGKSLFMSTFVHIMILFCTKLNIEPYEL